MLAQELFPARRGLWGSSSESGTMGGWEGGLTIGRERLLISAMTASLSPRNPSLFMSCWTRLWMAGISLFIWGKTTCSARHDRFFACMKHEYDTRTVMVSATYPDREGYGKGQT